MGNLRYIGIWSLVVINLISVAIGFHCQDLRTIIIAGVCNVLLIGLMILCIYLAGRRCNHESSGNSI